MSEGRSTCVESNACPKGPPKGGVWFTVSIKVYGKDVQVHLSGHLVTSTTSHFAPRARGGAFTFHGCQNVVFFKELKIVPQLQFYVLKRCLNTVQYPDYVKLDANNSTWTQDRFCQATYLKNGGQTTDYQLSVDLFNVI